MQRVAFDLYEMDSLIVPYIEPSSFEFREDRPLHLLQRLCFWALSKVGAYRRGEYTSTVRRHVVEPDDFMERLFTQRRALAENFNLEAKEILIGAVDYAELMSCELINQVIQFDAKYHTQRSGCRPEIHGLSVRVIPWMSGMVVL